MTSELEIVEFFTSIQGESTFTGLPCHFVRLAGCNLSCNFCDTPYSQSKDGAIKITLDNIFETVYNHKIKLIEFTGGEPLLQMDGVVRACRMLVDHATILIETNGSLSIEEFKSAPNNVILIMDCKTPSSRMSEQMHWANYLYLRPVDEVKFVVSNREDFDYARKIVEEFEIEDHKLLISPAYTKIGLEDLANWILTDAPYFRLQFQLHKLIWGPTKRGV